MATVKFPRNEIEKHLKLDNKNLENISMFGTPVESLTKDQLEIEIFPNRPDLIPSYGFLRAMNTFMGKKQKQYSFKKPSKDYKIKIKKSVKPVRPYTTGAIVKNIKLDNEKIKELVYIQEKIHSTLGRQRKKLAIGIYPLDKIKLPITYEANSPEDIRFIPLGASKEMNGNQVLQKHPTGKEYSHLLKEHKTFPVFRDSNKNVLSLPPIINSHETGKITTDTNNLFIECSGNNLPVLKQTIAILATAFADMGGEVHQMKIVDEAGKDFVSPDLTPKRTKIRKENANKILGLNLTEKDISNLLTKMGHSYDLKTKEALTPSWRTDILHEIDLIEDIAIAYGYQNLTPDLIEISTVGEESRKSQINKRIREMLVGAQLLEISTLHLIKPDEAKKLKLKETLELEDSKTEYKILRPNLLAPALRILAENTDVEYPQKIFEIGTVFSESNSTDTEIEENQNLLVGLSPGNFTEIKQILDSLTSLLNIGYQLKESTHPTLIEGRTASIIINNKEIGYIGEAHPSSLKNWGLKMPLSILEINLEEIYKNLD